MILTDFEILLISGKKIKTKELILQDKIEYGK